MRSRRARDERRGTYDSARPARDGVKRAYDTSSITL